MTLATFLDGPATGRTLMLKRSPKFLRVVESDGGFDALDQPDDTPRPTEKLYAYQLADKRGTVHICGGRASGWHALVDYKVISEQPTDETMRGTDKWREWCYRMQPAVTQCDTDAE